MIPITIRHKESLNHNVRRIVADKPAGYSYTPGQATLVALDQDGMREEKHPFTFTSLPDADHLEFTIKIYPEHEGVTAAIDRLQEGDRLLIEEPWGAITYHGPGTFLAGGAGLTPFLAILRDQARKNGSEANQLFFSNRTEKDLFLADELKKITGGVLLLTFTAEKVEGCEFGRMDSDFLQKHIADWDQHFYVCGPPEMVESVSNDLKSLGVDAGKIVTEES